MTEDLKNKPLLDVLCKRKPMRVPFWLMRQAGRYLPEYLELRAKKKSFLDMAYDPEFAAEISLQPLRRFGMDGAILFSDILVIPDALGQKVEFVGGEGPKLQPLFSESDFSKLNFDRVENHLKPVFEAIKKIREKLVEESFHQTTLIGFCGAPWTVICYMIEGGGSKDFEAARRWALHDPQSFQKLVDLVTAASCVYLSAQIKAGVEVVQIFESWGGLLDGAEFAQWIIEPTKIIRDYLKKAHPEIPVIGFPRGAGVLAKDYALKTGIDCIGLDHVIDPAWVVRELCPHVVVQGNLDPVRLLCGGQALESGMEDIHAAFHGQNFIFNLGHGIIKETKIANVEKLRDIVRGWSV